MYRIEFTRTLGRGITVLFFSVVLAACGGGGEDVAQAPATGSTLSGVAAVGYPIVNGTVSVVCAAGVVPATTTSSAGAWQVSATGLTLPCAVQVSGGTINSVASTAKYHSLAVSIGTVNITPLTDLMVADFAATSTPDAWFTGLTPTTVAQAQITPASVNTALGNLRTALAALTLLDAIDPITTAFTPTAGNPVDDLLVALKTAMTSTTVTHADLLNNMSLPNFTAPTGFGTALTTAFAGTVSGGALPLAPAGLIATAGDGQVTITWAPVAGATSYKLYMSEVPGISLANPANMHHLSVSSPFIHPGLINGTTWYFVVTAVNKNGESVGSTEVSATPQALPVPPITGNNSLAVTNAPVSVGGTFVPDPIETVVDILGNNMDITFGEAGLSLTQGEVLTVTVDLAVTGGDPLVSYNVMSNAGSIRTWICAANLPGGLVPLCQGFTLNRTAGTVTFVNTVLSEFGGTQITLNGTLGFTSAAPAPAPTVTLTALSSSIASGTTSILSWTSTNSTSCISPGGVAAGTTGTFTTPALTATTTYIVTCTGAGGITSQNATVTVSVGSGPATWSRTGSMFTRRSNHTATLLPNGKVLVAGGSDGNTGNTVSSAELYDPVTGSWSGTGNMFQARWGHTATLLPNGKVLVAGGRDFFGAVGSAELYDPVTGSWSRTGYMMFEVRMGHTATLLPNGKVLVAGGSDGFGNLLSSAILYDSVTGSWSGTGSMLTVRISHTATLLPNGKVLVAGGFSSADITAGAELYDPVTGSWSGTGSMIAARFHHTATLLPNGKVLVAGGGGFFGAVGFASAELYDLVTGSWSGTGSMIEARSEHTATLLPNGKVLMAGGSASFTLSSAELYDPVTGISIATGSMLSPHTEHTATLLPNGKVLVGSFGDPNSELYW